MWFRVDSTNPLNFAGAWRQWELEHPCPPEERGSWAAFSPDGGSEPWHLSTLQNSFSDLVVCALGEVEAALRSWHALRVTAATALATNTRPDGLVQAVIRWKTLEAMRL